MGSMQDMMDQLEDRVATLKDKWNSNIGEEFLLWQRMSPYSTITYGLIGDEIEVSMTRPMGVLYISLPASAAITIGSIDLELGDVQTNVCESIKIDNLKPLHKLFIGKREVGRSPGQLPRPDTVRVQLKEMRRKLKEFKQKA